MTEEETISIDQAAYWLDDMRKNIHKDIDIKMRKKCAYCGVRETSLWRKGWYDKETNKNLSLCNAHGLRYSKGQYCPECNYIYYARELHPDKWKYCQKCGHYVHQKCISKHHHNSAGC